MNKFKFDENNTFCINLDSNIERWNRMQKRFDNINLKVSKWKASTIEDISDNFDEKLSDLQKACAQSHLNVWKYIVEKNLEYGFILEDDACFDKKWLDKLNEFNYDKWNGIFLNSSEPLTELNKWTEIKDHYLCGGYIITYYSAKFLIDAFKECYYSADWMTTELQYYGNSYSYFPWLIIQEGKDTTINSNVDLDHQKVIKCLNEINYSIDNYNI